MKPTNKIAVYNSPTLAKALNLPLTNNENDYDFLLIMTEGYLGLKKTTEKSKPLYVDFLSAEMVRRREQATLRKESLARALGLKSNTHPQIIDATAGLGRDSFILASLGFEVTLLERSPIVFSLLQNGLMRAAQNEILAPIVARMHLIQTDAIAWLKKSAQPDLIYLDPMFPERRKSALVKKDMQFFQEIIEESDDDTLFRTALVCARQRVVVKRPRLASSLLGMEPNFSLVGSSSRFDVYLIGS